ncbi:6-carboxytetrahydropterin synthase [bacterium]|nr:6-carboxytetrahydropterin synthase [bacterium]
MIATVGRKAHFNAAHRLYRPDWSDARNESVFGKCNNPNYHGHNYELIAELTGPIDPETGYVFDIKHLSDLIEREVEARFDHKNLNLDCPEFAQLIPSAEHIAQVIWNLLRPHLPINLQLKITLYETPRNFVVYKGEQTH